MAGNEKKLFGRCESGGSNGGGVRFHSLNFDRFENV